MENKKITPVDIQRMKTEDKKITMLSIYDYPMAMLADRAGIDSILVGDSLGMTILGYENTVPVTMDEMIHHTKAVSRGAKSALIVGDMPFMSYASERDAVLNAGRFLKEGGADAVKIEGGNNVVSIVKAIIRAGIAVVGHIGLTIQLNARWSQGPGKGSEISQKNHRRCIDHRRRRGLFHHP